MDIAIQYAICVAPIHLMAYFALQLEASEIQGI